MKTSEAQRRAVDEYNKKQDDVKVRFIKGSREQVRLYAKEHGYNSLQAYIKALIKRDSDIDV